MYFDFEDFRPDINPVGRAISWREGVLLSLVLHMAAAILILLSPRFLPTRSPQAIAQLAAERPSEPTRFVFVRPRVDTKAPAPPPRAELSDEDRAARARERAQTPENELPRMRGNSPERVEQMQREQARGRGPGQPDPQQAAEPPPPQSEPLPPEQPTEQARRENEVELPDAPGRLRLPPQQPPQRVPRIAGGSLGESLRNLERYIEQDQFNNPQGGGGQYGPFIQFDTKGVDFGRWIARFKYQVEGNWMIPLAASMSHGHVVITFNVHRNGNITDLQVVKPAAIASFNNAALGALSSSNPTVPLPEEYPLDKAFFTVTFFYNEEPPRE